MRRYDGGYVMVDLSVKDKVHELLLKALNGNKPIMVYEENGVPYFAKKLVKVGTDLVLQAGEKTVVVKANGTVVDSTAIEDITKIDGSILSALQCGDIICKLTTGEKHTYIVSYKKEDTGICLTYADATVVETVSYDYTDNAWVYNSTDSTPIGE